MCNDIVLQHNASCGRDDPLLCFPPLPGQQPVEYPPTIAHLIVAGNESLPNGTKNSWNKEKSAALLQSLDPGYHTEDDTDGEFSPRSRNRRLKVAKVLGITRAQLNFAQLTL